VGPLPNRNPMALFFFRVSNGACYLYSWGDGPNLLPPNGLGPARFRYCRWATLAKFPEN
jgi:hypothetical protein